VTIDAPLLLRAAEAAAGAQQYPPAALYVVATPIGNLADLSLRAIHVLARMDAVACEDTRNTGALLTHLGLSKPLLALHAHNEAQAAQLVCARLAQGERVAYASDAGTPGVSDPGARLVAAVHAAGHRVIPIPGPSSALAALSAAGDPQASGFAFEGFLPARGTPRRAALERVCDAAPAQILFESPHRIAELAAELGARAPQRRLTLARELTKQFETIATMAARELPGWLAQDPNRMRGEFVIVLHAQASAPAGAHAGLDPGAQRLLQALLRELPLKRAVALATELGAAPRNLLYEAALAWRQAQGNGGGEGGEDSEGGGNPAGDLTASSSPTGR
jgi:16S rRNA (cytidine1402-2'-O)-methyltransferase